MKQVPKNSPTLNLKWILDGSETNAAALLQKLHQIQSKNPQTRVNVQVTGNPSDQLLSELDALQSKPRPNLWMILAIGTAVYLSILSILYGLATWPL